MSVNSSFDSHGSHNPNFPRDSSFESRYKGIDLLETTPE